MRGRKILTGLSLSAGIVVCIIALFYAPGPQPWPALRGASRVLLLSAVVVTVAETLFRGLRLCIVTQAVGGRVSLWTSVRITLAGDFAAAITPSRFGGEPARLFALIRNGLSAGAAGAVLFGEFATDLCALGFLIAAAFGLFEGATQLRTIWVSAALLASVAAAVGCAMRWPEFLDRLWAPLARWRPVAWALRKAGIERFQLSQWVVDVRRRSYRLFATGWRKMTVGGAYALLHTTARFAVLPLLAAAFGAPIGLQSAILIQLAIFYGFALVPTPGGSGVPDAMAFTALSLAAPSAPVGLLLVLWRFLTCYLGGAMGGLLAPGLFRQETQDMGQKVRIQSPESRVQSQSD